jgi:malate dehydrogenase
VLKAKGTSSAMSAAVAVTDHMRDWFVGSKRIVSMAVVPPVGTYGIDEDLCFSLPVRCTGNFKYEIIEGLEFDEASQKRIDITLAELKDEARTAEL